MRATKARPLINLAEGQQPDATRRKFPPHIVLDATADMPAHAA